MSQSETDCRVYEAVYRYYLHVTNLGEVGGRNRDDSLTGLLRHLGDLRVFGWEAYSTERLGSNVQFIVQTEGRVVARTVGGRRNLS